MKYLVMVQNTQADYDAMAGGGVWSERDKKAMFGFMGALNDDLAESGELVDANGLVTPARTRLVSAGGDGRPVITDGPYGETKELMCGYWVLDCESLERVTEIAARVTQCPLPEGASRYPVVIRPIDENGGADL